MMQKVLTIILPLLLSQPVMQVPEAVINGNFETGQPTPWTQTVGLNQGGEVHVETHTRVADDPGSGSFVLHTRLGGQANGHTSVDLSQDISSFGLTADKQISLSFYNKNNVNPCGSVDPPMADCWRIVGVIIFYQRADQTVNSVAWFRYWYCDGTQCPEWVLMDFGLEGNVEFDVDAKIPQADRNAGTKLTQIVLQNMYKTFQTRGGSSTEKLDLFWDNIRLTATRAVEIDIKPGSFPNSINPGSRGKIPVAILSTAGFDAPHSVNAASLTFGLTGDETSLAFCNGNGEDVDNDGLLDLVCHFGTPSTGFQSADTAGILRGLLLDGTPIEGRDPVTIVP